jgi:hypothetical protein
MPDALFVVTKYRITQYNFTYGFLETTLLVWGSVLNSVTRIELKYLTCL